MARARSQHARYVADTRIKAEARWRADGKPIPAFLQGWRHLNRLEQIATPTAADIAYRDSVLDGLSGMKGPRIAACPLLLVEVAERIFDWPPAKYQRPFDHSKWICRLARKLLSGATQGNVSAQVWAEYRSAEKDCASGAVTIAFKAVGLALDPSGPPRVRKPTEFSITNIILKRRIIASADAGLRNPALRAEFAAAAGAEADKRALELKIARHKNHWGHAVSAGADSIRRERKLEKERYERHIEKMRKAAKARKLRDQKSRPNQVKNPDGDR